MLYHTVENCLRAYPETRDSDRKLLIRVWEAEGLYLTDAQKDRLMLISSPETIRRTRQKLQQAGRYLGSEKIRNTRRLKSMIVQQNIPKLRAEQTDNILNLGVEPIRRIEP